MWLTYISEHIYPPTHICQQPHSHTLSRSIADCLNPWICFVLANWEQSELKALQWINTAVIRADLFLWPCEREDSGSEKSEGEWEKAQTPETVFCCEKCSHSADSSFSCWKVKLKPSCVKRFRPAFEAIAWVQHKLSSFCGICGITTGNNLSKKAKIVVTVREVQ